MSTPTVRPIEWGEEVTVHDGDRDVVWVSAKPCEDGIEGHWYCATHREGFSNNMMKDSHISGSGEHAMAWVCHVHGIEVP